MANEKRLIDANALITEYDRVHIGDPGKARKLMEDAPTVDAVEVVHGKWLYDSGSERYFCSACNENALSVTYEEQVADYDWEENLVFHTETATKEFWTDYCPNCGAKMDGGNEDV